MKGKFSAVRRGVFSILFWSVISAAFIGPGTVTTAAKAGSSFGCSLLWALLFSTFTCLLLQEAAARVAIVSGMNMGQALIRIAPTGKRKLGIIILVAGAIIIGSAAYEAGNIMGAVSGLRLLLPWPAWIFTLATGGVAFLALYLSRTETLARILGFLVIVMGASFFTTALLVRPDLSSLLQGLLIPRIPEGGGAGMLILGLIGTTVVPYNLFLGSGIARKAEGVKMMRFGLGVSVLLGGVVSMAVLVVGTTVKGNFSFEALSRSLLSDLGPAGAMVFAVGLSAAGLSSAITAPMASSITADSVSGDNEFWKKGGRGFFAVWASVLLTGVVFGLAGLKPVPVIIVAQAFNGLILPVVAVVLMVIVNNPAIMKKEYLNSRIQNFLMVIVVLVTVVLGSTSLAGSFFGITGFIPIPEWQVVAAALVFACLLLVYISRRIKRDMRNPDRNEGP